jgi:hypothetical protein
LDEEKSKYAPLAQQNGFDPAFLYHPEMLCDPVKIFLTSKLCYLSFSNPTHKIKTRIASSWDTSNGNPPGAIKLSNQSLAGVVRLC